MSQLEMNFVPIASVARPRDQQDLMSFPCFSLAKGKRTDILEYKDSKGNFLVVSPNPLYGMATVWDFDIILYFVALIRHMVEKEKQIPTVFDVAAYDILKFCGRSTGKTQYKQLSGAMDRLSSTYIKTNIREEVVADQEIERREKYLRFTWLANVTEETTTRLDKKTGRQKEVLQKYKVQLPQWLVDGVVNSKLVLGINPSYFQLTSGIERFLYRTARKFSGINENGVRYTLQHIYERSGSTSSYRQFKAQIKKAILKNNIPDYHFGLYKQGGKEWLFFQKKETPDDYKDPHPSFEEKLQSFELIAETPRTTDQSD